MDAMKAIEQISETTPNTTATSVQAASAPTAAESVAPEFLLPLRRPISWAGTTYTELDLSGLETLCAEHLTDAHRAVTQVNPTAIVPSMDPLYARTIVSAITGIPEIMLKTMDARDAMKMQQRVLSFLND